MVNQEEIPWWICKKEDKNFCTYVDTDSNYFHAEPLLKHLYPNFTELPEEEQDDLLEKMALKYQDLITEYYDTLANEAFNIPTHRLEMKTECTIRSGFFSGKRRYAQDIKKYIERPPGAGNIFTTLKTGTPVNAKAAIRYNDFLKFKGIDKQHSQIVQGDKIKWVYLKDNPYKIDTMGFLDFDFPEGVRTFVETYVDRDKAFDSILKNKLESFYQDLSWGSLTLNTHVNNFFSF